MRKKSRQMPQNLEGFLAHTISETGPKSVIDSLAFLTGSFVISLKGRIVEFNEAFVRLIGYEPEELHGMSVFDLVHPEERASVERRLANSTTGQYKVKLFTKSGQTKYTLAAPCHFNVLGKVYRLTQLIDNTDYVNQYRQHLINLRGTAQALTRAIEQRDSYTTGHMSRVARIALKIGQMLLLEESLLEDLIIGSSIHDIGKIAVPIEILAKPGKLEEHEWAYIRRHPEIGYSIIGGVDFEDRIKKIVLLHHEYQDGSGYPYGYSAGKIPVEAAITTVADSLDAISGIRPYRQAYTNEEAIELMGKYQTRYLPEAFDAARHLVKSGELDKASEATSLFI